MTFKPSGRHSYPSAFVYISKTDSDTKVKLVGSSRGRTFKESELRRPTAGPLQRTDLSQVPLWLENIFVTYLWCDSLCINAFHMVAASSFFWLLCWLFTWLYPNLSAIFLVYPNSSVCCPVGRGSESPSPKWPVSISGLSTRSSHLPTGWLAYHIRRYGVYSRPSRFADSYVYVAVSFPSFIPTDLLPEVWDPYRRS